MFEMGFILQKYKSTMDRKIRPCMSKIQKREVYQSIVYKKAVQFSKTGTEAEGDLKQLDYGGYGGIQSKHPWVLIFGTQVNQPFLNNSVPLAGGDRSLQN